MALTRAERRSYMNQLFDNQDRLEQEKLSRTDRRTCTNLMFEALDKLDAGEQPDAAIALYERIMKGEFNSLPVEPFVKKVEEALEEVDGDGLPEAQNCAKQYLQAHYDATERMFIAA